MLKAPIDYSKTIIYKIEHIEYEDLVYVRHTTSWDKRKCNHKVNCYNENDKKFNQKLYQMIRENGGWDMFKMVVVEKYPCNDKREAEKRENEIMKELKANMNTYRSYITDEEIKATQKECLKKYRYNYKSNKEYRDKLLEKHRQYYENNKDKRNEKVKCECGCSITKRSIKRHQTSKKHINLIKKKI